MALTLVQLAEAIRKYGDRGTFSAHDRAAFDRNLDLFVGRTAAAEPVIAAARKLAVADPVLSDKPGVAIHQLLIAIGAEGLSNDPAHPETLTYSTGEVISLATPEQNAELALLGFFSVPGSHAGVDYSLFEQYYEITPSGDLDVNGQPTGGNWVPKDPGRSAWATYLASK